MIQQSPPEIDKLFEAGSAIDEAIAEAARDARLKHKQLGVPLVVWRSGQIVEIPPEEIVVDPPQQQEGRAGSHESSAGTAGGTDTHD